MTKRNASTLFSCSIATLAGIALSASIAHAQDTQIDDVIMYGIDADTFNLLRYEFSTDTFTIVGKVKENPGPVVKDVEGLAYIPRGIHKGLYGTTNFNDTQPTRLVEINPFDASAYMYPDVVGFWKVSGLVAYKDPNTNQWSLLGATKHTNNNDFQAKLIRIDPATGIGTEVMDFNDFGPGPNGLMMSGLALDANNTLYGIDRGLNLPGEVPQNTRSDLYIIDWDLSLGPQGLTHIADVPWIKVEALEFGFGDTAPPIDCSTVPGTDPSWFTNGVLFGFSDNDDKLFIIDPATANAVSFPSSFNTIDCEGLILVTDKTDPRDGLDDGFD